MKISDKPFIERHRFTHFSSLSDITLPWKNEEKDASFT
jgi:hypothetical protein